MAQSISARANLDLSVTVQDAADSGELGAYSLTLTAGTSAWSAITESLTNGNTCSNGNTYSNAFPNAHSFGNTKSCTKPYCYPEWAYPSRR